MRTRIKQSKIEEALELLNHAAQEEKTNVSELLDDKYDDLKGLLGSVIQGGPMTGKSRKKIVRNLYQKVKKVNRAIRILGKKVYKEPVAFLGIAVGSLALGLFLGRKK